MILRFLYLLLFNLKTKIKIRFNTQCRNDISIDIVLIQICNQMQQKRYFNKFLTSLSAFHLSFKISSCVHSLNLIGSILLWAWFISIFSFCWYLEFMIKLTLRKKCPYLELFWSAFSRIRNFLRCVILVLQYVWLPILGFGSNLLPRLS